MEFNFKIQPYQTEAVERISEVFKGESFNDTNKYIFDMGAKYNRLLNPDPIEAVSNHPIELTDDQLLQNIIQVQKSAGIKESEKLDKSLGRCSLDIEMETGTGKTYVYIKTMFELNKRYGWSKFIVVVPSIAIREGVYKTFQVTQKHFKEYYGKKATFFVYKSSNLQCLNGFSRDDGINVMIINSQAFAKSFSEGGKGKDSRIIYEERDDFESRRPIDVIAANRPIIILDEPQKLNGKATQEALKKHFNALFTMNFSATHSVNHDLIHSLDAVDAYNEKLVKKIEVKGIETKNIAGTSGYIYVDNFILDLKNPPRIRLEIDVLRSNGIKRENHIFDEVGGNLYIESNGLEAYRGLFITEINPDSDYVEFSNGIRLHPGEVVGDIVEEDLRRVQIRETICSHFEKEEALFKKGIKCLSLFFIDRVDRYRIYDESDHESLGLYGKIFEEEYQKYVREHIFFFDSEYKRYVESIPVESTHKGYFSIDKKTKRIVDSPIKAKADYSDDESAYDLILKDKERLLSFEEPTRFIFSHSALSEGWDNPNVFQICALKHSESNIRKRQEVGRGLRLCVDATGVRMDVQQCGDSVHEINILTVIASEGYESFVRGLQDAMAKDLHERPTKIDKKLLSEIKMASDEGINSIPKQDVDKIYYHLIRAGYLDESDQPTDECKRAMKEGLELFGPDSGLAGYANIITELIGAVIDGKSIDDMFTDGKGARITDNKLNENFNREEFRALWKEINHKYVYFVSYDSLELIQKSVASINKNLFVSSSSHAIVTGSQKEAIEGADIKHGSSFEVHKQEFRVSEESDSDVKYDLIGRIADGSEITRHSAVQILKGIDQKHFDMFKQNPEEFINKTCKLIRNEKATMVIDHITYNRTDEVFDSSIFTESKASCDPKKAFQGKKHIMDYVFTDGLSEESIELKFAESLEKADEVAVYAKLPRGFWIPTPVGNYTPDWAIAFNDLKGIRHIYFIAETKGTMDSLQLKPIEQTKIGCASKVYNVADSKVRYHYVDTYENLLSIIRNME